MWFENIVLIGYRVQEIVRHTFCFNKTRVNQRTREETQNSLACLHIVVSGVLLIREQIELSTKAEDTTAMPFTIYKEIRGTFKVTNFLIKSFRFMEKMSR